MLGVDVTPLIELNKRFEDAKAETSDQPRAVRFETALCSLQDGLAVRRKCWEPGEFIFLFYYNRAPIIFRVVYGCDSLVGTGHWRASASDLLADDWEVMK